MIRMSRTEYFMRIAELVAKRSTCERAQVGCVLVSNNRIVSTGYNGSISGAPHCIDAGCLIHDGHCIRTVHAEMNSILHLEHTYYSLELYCTHGVCYNCLKAAVSAKVRYIMFREPYKDEGQVDSLMKEFKNIITFIQVDEKYDVHPVII